MNQVALSCVVLRVLGIYLIVSYTAVFAAQVWWPFVSAFEYSGFDAFLLLTFAVTVLLPLGVGFALVLLAGRLSKLLFPDNRDVLIAGTINGDALFYVGVALLGLYFFISYLPSTLVSVIDWFRFTAATPSIGEFGEYVGEPDRYLPFDGLIMIVLSLMLIFRRRSICDFLNRVSK